MIRATWLSVSAGKLTPFCVCSCHCSPGGKSVSTMTGPKKMNKAKLKCGARQSPWWKDVSNFLWVLLKKSSATKHHRLIQISIRHLWDWYLWYYVIKVIYLLWAPADVNCKKKKKTISPESPFRFQCGFVTVTRRKSGLFLMANVITDIEQ